MDENVTEIIARDNTDGLLSNIALHSSIGNILPSHRGHFYTLEDVSND